MILLYGSCQDALESPELKNLARNEKTKRHETIHFQQQIELLFIVQWILYGVFHLIGLVKEKGNGKKAYYHNPFELEAYDNDETIDYLIKRKPYAWLKYWRIS